MTDDSVFKNTTALFHSFGCKLNFAETSTVARTLSPFERPSHGRHSKSTPSILTLDSESISPSKTLAVRSFFITWMSYGLMSIPTSEPTGKEL